MQLDHSLKLKLPELLTHCPADPKVSHHVDVYLIVRVIVCLLTAVTGATTAKNTAGSIDQKRSVSDKETHPGTEAGRGHPSDP